LIYSLNCRYWLASERYWSVGR